MRITELNFFKFLKQADIVCLINYVEDNRFLLETDSVDEVQFLFEFFQRKYGNEFNPVTVLKYIYMFVPKRRTGLSSLKLTLTIAEMQEFITRYQHFYNVESIGEGALYKEINQLEQFRQIRTRQEVWLEAIETNVFLEAYRFWPPSWKERRAIFSYKNRGMVYLVALRKVGYKLIVSEVKSVNGGTVDILIVNKIQNTIDTVVKQHTKRLALEEVLN